MELKFAKSAKMKLDYTRLGNIVVCFYFETN